MQEKHLYNIETDTLLIIDPLSMSIVVKNSYTQTFQISNTSFAFVYLMAIAHPHMVSYKDFYHFYESVGILVTNQKQLDAVASKVKKDLKSFKVKDYVIKVKRKGYAVSSKWVAPSDAEFAKQSQRLLKYFKKMVPIFNPSKSK